VSTRTVANMAVEITGDGVPVICIHGLGGTSNSFTPMLPALTSMRVIRPDLPCSGRSPMVEKPSIAQIVSFIVRLADSLGIKSAHFMGHSLGTIVCQHIASSHSELVRSLVLLGALSEPPGVARENIRRRAATARGGGMSEVADQVAQGGTSSDTKTKNPAAVAFVRESILRQDPEGYARTCEALAEAHAADLSRIRCPALLISGDEDAVAPPSMARSIAAAIAGAKTVVLPRCGHWIMLERPEEVNAEVKRFF
jgi:3-oxoadipate enol-lactonase